MNSNSEIQKYLSQFGDKWRCDACDKFDWMIIDYPIGKVRTKLCYDCWIQLDGANKIADEIRIKEDLLWNA